MLAPREQRAYETIMDHRPMTPFKSLSRFLVVAAILAGAPTLARADLPRPEGWEPTCTIEKEQKSGGPCEQCRGYQNPDPCQDALEKKGYTRRCQEGGAGSYVAVWCKGAASPSSSAGLPAKSPETPPTALPTQAPSASASPSASPTPAAVPPAADNRRGSSNCGIGVESSSSREEGIGRALGNRSGLGTSAPPPITVKAWALPDAFAPAEGSRGPRSHALSGTSRGPRPNEARQS